MSEEPVPIMSVSGGGELLDAHASSAIQSKGQSWCEDMSKLVKSVRWHSHVKKGQLEPAMKHLQILPTLSRRLGSEMAISGLTKHLNGYAKLPLMLDSSDLRLVSGTKHTSGA